MKEASVIVVSGQKPSLSMKSQQEVKNKISYGFLPLALQTDVPPSTGAGRPGQGGEVTPLEGCLEISNLLRGGAEEHELGGQGQRVPKGCAEKEGS